MSNAIVPSIDLREAALELAERGHSVFSLRPRAKRPLTANGLLDATTDLQQVNRWWSQNRWANIGLRTGDGLVVIDVDPRSGGKVDPAWPATLTVHTPSGGWHFYYMTAVSVPCSAGRLAAGVDVRGDGGYVVAPPSRTHAGAWRWGQESLVAMLPTELEQAMLPTELEQATGSRSYEACGGSAVSQRFIPRERVGSGERNDYLARYAGSLYGQGYAEGQVTSFLAIENEAVCAPPLPDAEVEQIVASIGRYHR